MVGTRNVTRFVSDSLIRGRAGNLQPRVLRLCRPSSVEVGMAGYAIFTELADSNQFGGGGGGDAT